MSLNGIIHSHDKYKQKIFILYVFSHKSAQWLNQIILHTSLLILPILNLLDLADLDPLLDVAVGGWSRNAEGGGEFLIGLAVKRFREGVEEGLLPRKFDTCKKQNM